MQIKQSPGKTLSIKKVTNDVKETIKITPDEYLGDGRIGAQLQANFDGNRAFIKWNSSFMHTESVYPLSGDLGQIAS